MKDLFVALLIFVIASPGLCANADPIFNVVDYGAVGDGTTDDSDAFVKAWQNLCGATQGTPTLVVPIGKTFMLQPVVFKGPCISTNVNIKLQGTIIAPQSVSAWKWSNDDDKESWVEFSGINGLVINGGGQVDGQGAPWWGHDDEDNRPTALRFFECENLILSTLTHINSPRNHISIDTCNGCSISNLHIIAPKESPNTDGIDISKSSNILIQSSTIETGSIRDDCIAINSGSTIINIKGISCGPGHGISVGSLGRHGTYATVEEVHVQDCTLTGTTNGARIKTWAGGCGYARKITFEDIKLDEVGNPIIIDQHYQYLVVEVAEEVTNVTNHNVKTSTIKDVDQQNCDDNNKAVKVSDVTFRNVKGTSTVENAIQLNCDTTNGCTNIIVDDVYITYDVKEKTTASCNNVQGKISYSSFPNVPCLTRVQDVPEPRYNSPPETNPWGTFTSQVISVNDARLSIRIVKVFVVICTMFCLGGNW